MPAVTAVVPVWGDYVSLLGGCVASLLSQSPVPRVLIVDNASSTPVEALPGTEVVRLEERVAVGEARNAALPWVDTEFVLFVDADDELLPGALADLVAALTPQEVFAGGGIVELRDGEPDRAVAWPPPIVHRLAPRPRLLALRALWLSCLPATCTLFRTDVVRDAGGFGEGSLGEDWSLITAVAFRGRGALLDRPVRRYRFSEGSLFHTARALDVRLESHRVVRHRILRDPAVPLWVKGLMPLFAAHHGWFLRREPE